MISRRQLTRSWDDVDPWWNAHTSSSRVVGTSFIDREVSPEWLTDCWSELEPWWTEYIEIGYETAVELWKLLERSNERWANAAGPFDTDPLATDLTGTRHSRGPLEPSDEVAWSRWLARILRPSRALVSELFDLRVTAPPSEVIREERLSKEAGGFRRPDILICHAERGVSIEVKLGDEHYGKTAETGMLVERHYDDREWVHSILLPKRKLGRLETIVDLPLESTVEGQRYLQCHEPGPIRVLSWQDVTAAIRSVLRRGEFVDDHWAANAYLFCAVAEQRIANFQPQPTVRRLADPASVVDTIVPINVADSLEEQLLYFHERADA